MSTIKSTPFTDAEFAEFEFYKMACCTGCGNTGLMPRIGLGRACVELCAVCHGRSKITDIEISRLVATIRHLKE